MAADGPVGSPCVIARLVGSGCVPGWVALSLLRKSKWAERHDPQTRLATGEREGQIPKERRVKSTKYPRSTVPCTLEEEAGRGAGGRLSMSEPAALLSRTPHLPETRV